MIVYILSVVVAGLCGAVLHRCVGGFIGIGNTTAARFLWWAMPTALLVAVLNFAATGFVSPILFTLVLLAVYIGRLIPHGWTQNKGWDQYVGMAWIGAARMTIVALACQPYFDLLSTLPWCGMLAGIAYAIGYEVIGDRELFIWHPWNPNTEEGYDHFARTGGEWGEVLVGFFYWAALTALILKGVPDGFLVKHTF